MKTAVIIPARLASTRLPRKALADIHGKPTIQWVYERSKAAKLVDEVFVATPDEELKEVVEGFGGKVILTGPAPTVLDRCSEASNKLIISSDAPENIIVVQGDEPTINPDMIDLVVENESPNICLVKQITREEAHNPNTVKAIFDKDNYFIYLSRSIIPGGSPEKDYSGFAPKYYKQVCIMKFHPTLISAFSSITINQLEKSEGIDLVRYIEHGQWYIKAVETDYETQALDTAEDLEKIRKMLA